MEVALLVILILLICMLIFLVIKKADKNIDLMVFVDPIRKLIQEETRTNRAELQDSISKSRGESSSYFMNFRKEVLDGLETYRFTQREDYSKLLQFVEQKFQQAQLIQQEEARKHRQELTAAFQDFEQRVSSSIKSFNELQKEKFAAMENKQSDLISMTELKLEKMRETVDEKLHKTLEERLGQSFNAVTQQLNLVHTGLGEMQNLASGVGDLKRVLSNVKTRGTLGEMQLESILSEILIPEQFVKNFKPSKNSSEVVEFAIKLPGEKDTSSEVYLPLDSKFPLDDYTRMQDAWDKGETESIDALRKSLYSSIKKCAKDIRDKYIKPPTTTDFAVMFLPFEGLYAEIARDSDILLTLQRDYKVIITGPTTLSALLNSLQVGFKTLQIQKRTGEIWKVLERVRKEFQSFGEVLNKAQKKLNEANLELDSLKGKKSRNIQQSLEKLHTYKPEDISFEEVETLQLEDNDNES